MNITSPIVQFFIKIFNSQSFYANNINKNISLFVHSTRMQIMFYLISFFHFIPICPLIIHPFFLLLCSWEIITVLNFFQNTGFNLKYLKVWVKSKI